MPRSASAASARSTPPRPSTRRGRAAHNALSHGLRSLVPVIPGVESEEEWLAHLAGVIQELAPVGQIEQLMGERIALDFWRLKRVARYETLLVIHSDPDSRPNPPAQASASSDVGATDHGDDGDDGDDSEDIDEDDWEQIEAQLPEQARDLLHRFDFIMFSEESQPVAAPDALAVVDAIRGRICGFPLSSFAVPDTKDVPLTDCAGWTAGLVRRTIRAMCERFQKDPASEISHAVHVYRQIAERDPEPRTTTPSPVISPLARHPLPPAHILDRLLRYEAHLTRDLRLWLADLERWQARRLDRERIPFDLLPGDGADNPVSAKRNGSTR